MLINEDGKYALFILGSKFGGVCARVRWKWPKMMGTHCADQAHRRGRSNHAHDLKFIGSI